MERLSRVRQLLRLSRQRKWSETTIILVDTRAIADSIPSFARWPISEVITVTLAEKIDTTLRFDEALIALLTALIQRQLSKTSGVLSSLLVLQTSKGGPNVLICHPVRLAAGPIIRRKLHYRVPSLFTRRHPRYSIPSGHPFDGS